MRRRAAAFAPGRVNLIGEHTDYNDGLCLPFAIAPGATVRPSRSPVGRSRRTALDLSERDDFDHRDPGRPADAARLARVRARRSRRAGARTAEAARLPRLEISRTVPIGAGLSSSAALTWRCAWRWPPRPAAGEPDRLELARLCSRVENDWVGAHTGLLDQLAALYGSEGRALRIDMRGPTCARSRSTLGD